MNPEQASATELQGRAFGFSISERYEKSPVSFLTPSLSQEGWVTGQRRVQVRKKNLCLIRGFTAKL